MAYECPACCKPGVSTLGKLFSTVAFPATCAFCGARAYSSSFVALLLAGFMAATAPILLLTWIITDFSFWVPAAVVALLLVEATLRLRGPIAQAAPKWPYINYLWGLGFAAVVLTLAASWSRYA